MQQDYFLLLSKNRVNVMYHSIHNMFFTDSLIEREYYFGPITSQG